MENELKIKLTFSEVIYKWKDHYYALNNVAKATRDNHTSYIRAIERFLLSIESPDILIEWVDNDLIDDMNVFLRKNGHGITNAGRTIKICKKVFKYAKLKKYIKHNEISDYEIQTEKVKEVVCLEENELQKMIYAETKDKALEIVKDRYVFQALTGLSYGDVNRYKIIKTNIGEHHVILLTYRRNKNETECWIPIEQMKRSDIILNLLKKYSGKFPHIGNRKYNVAIRELASNLGIEKYLTSHTARKTFATIAYDSGDWSAEALKTMLGHKHLSTTENRYLSKSKKRLESEVLRKIAV